MKSLKFLLSLIIICGIYSSCQKEYSLEGANLGLHAGTWEFNDSLKHYVGNIDTAFIETITGGKILHLLGTTADGLQHFDLNLNADSVFTVGTYKASLFQTDFEYFTSSQTLYQADGLAGEFTVNVTAIGNNSITGTFSGAAQDSAGVTKLLTAGKFTSKINLSGNGSGGGGTGAAVGTLGVSAGACTPETSSGTYTQGTPLTTSNTAQIQVTVTTPGTYTISTNTVNGVTFSNTGTFTTTGAQTVILTGSGTPTNSGAQTFTVTFGTSSCTFSVTFGSSGPAGAGTLGGAPGSCTPATANGTYTQGTALTSSNTLTIQVNVTTVGSYSISTNTVNGVSFSGSGTFTTTGVQNVTLNGTGTPTAAGAQNFTVTWLTSTCNFSITFAAGTVLDYFPTTLNSNWTYGLQGGTPSDSLFHKIVNTNYSVNSHVYAIMTEESFPVTGNPNDSFYVRKPGGDYYEYLDMAYYFGFENPVYSEFIFLKDNVNQGTTWQSPTFSGTFAGVPGTYTCYIQMTLTSKAVAATVGSFNFPDVDKMHYDFYVSAQPGTPFATEDIWYARGVGIIYDSSPSAPFTYNIGQYTIY